MRIIIIRYSTALVVKIDSSIKTSAKTFAHTRYLHTTHTSVRLTRNQQAVLDELNQQVRSVSAQDLYVLLRQKQTIGLATVYRSLEILKLRGLVQSRIISNGESLYSPVAIDQHHLTCLHCKQSFPLNADLLQELELHWQSALSFKIYYHTLEFFGLCEPCTALSTESSSV